MAISEGDQKEFEQIVANLTQGWSVPTARRSRRVVVGFAALIGGMCILLLAVGTNITFLGVLGFLLSLTGVVLLTRKSTWAGRVVHSDPEHGSKTRVLPK